MRASRFSCFSSSSSSRFVVGNASRFTLQGLTNERHFSTLPLLDRPKYFPDYRFRANNPKTRMTTPEHVVLYYATLSGIADKGTNNTPHNKTNKQKPIKKSNDRFSTATKKEIPVVDLQGQEYFDTHTHIDQILEKYSLPIEAYQEFKGTNFKSGFGGCVTVCCDKGSFKPTKILMEHEGIWAAFGIHPHNAKMYKDDIEKRIIEMMDHPKTVAWGEMGLDYHYDFSERPVQREVFARQLKKAVEFNKPIIIHSREAEEDTIALMREHVPKDWRIHVHCFTSSVSMAQTLLTEWPNCFIGITGAVTFGNADGVRDVVKAVPLDRLLLETDGPFMAPLPFRGEICHSGHIPFIAQKISEIKGISMGELLIAVRANTKRMYGV